MPSFALLARGRIARTELAPYFARVPCYREYNTQFFRLAPGLLAENLVGELLRSAAVTESDGVLAPAS